MAHLARNSAIVTPAGGGNRLPTSFGGNESDPRTADSRSRALARLVCAALLACALAFAGCSTPDAAPQPAQTAEQQTQAAPLPDAPADADAETIAEQAFQKEPDGFEIVAPDVPTVVIENEGEPSFTEEDTAYAESNPGYESYSQLDELGRCGPATACLGPETMPADGEERESISQVKPTGWNQAFYDNVDGEALWNRCHLIAWSLACENANEQNLVTGTRSMNTEAMLPYEEDVADYIDGTGNHVLYRATPVFEERELVCRGVLLEAESLEDDGAGISFSVFCVNVQPGIAIDYATGASHRSQETVAQAAETSGEQSRDYVLNTSSKRIHLLECSSVDDIKPANRQDVTATRESLIEQGYEPCGRCQP